jgi:mutator protein MutT
MKEVTRALIIDANNNVLIGLRGRGISANMWALVGGKREPGETPEACVIREVKEELGLHFHPTLWKVELDATSDQGVTWKVYYYIGKATGNVSRKEDEIADTRYVSLPDLDELPFAFGHKKILQDFFSKNIPT